MNVRSSRKWVRAQALMREAVFAFSWAALTFLSRRAYGQQQNLDTVLREATAAQTAGDYQTAATLYRRATVLSPETAELWSNLGVMEYFAGDLSPSMVSLRHALKLKPDLFASVLFVGKIYLEEKKQAEALPYLTHAHALQPKDAEVLRSLGKTCADLHREREAADSYQEMIRLTPQDVSAWLGLGSASLTLIARDGHTLATSAPDSPWARALYADELLAQGRPIEATDTYTTVFRHATSVEEMELARMLLFMRDHPMQFAFPAKSQAALQHLVDVTREQGVKSQTSLCGDEDRDSSFLSMGAACTFWASDYGQSAEQARKLLERTPHDAAALYWSVKANERLAVTALSRVDELAPDSTTTHDLVGDLYRYQHQWNNAIAEYGKALTLNPHDPAALLGAAASYLAARRYEEATSTMRTALADRPADPQSNLLMAEILGSQGHENDAAPYLAKCSSIAPQFQPRVHYLQARAAAKDGHIQKAIHDYELALPGDTDGSIHYQLSRLYRKIGNLTKAQQAETASKALVAKRDASAAVALREGDAP